MFAVRGFLSNCRSMKPRHPTRWPNTAMTAIAITQRNTSGTTQLGRAMMFSNVTFGLNRTPVIRPISPIGAASAASSGVGLGGVAIFLSSQANRKSPANLKIAASFYLRSELRNVSAPKCKPDTALIKIPIQSREHVPPPAAHQPILEPRRPLRAPPLLNPTRQYEVIPLDLGGSPLLQQGEAGL